MNNVSQNLHELSDNLLSLIITKPKSKLIVIKILNVKGYQKPEIREAIKELIKFNYISINDNSMIETNQNGRRIIEEGGFVFLDKINQKNKIKEQYEEIVKQSEKDKQVKFQDSAIKANDSNFNLHKYQRVFFVSNIVFAIINIVLIIYNIKNGN